MINLTFTVDNIGTVVTLYDRIQIRMYTGTGVPDSPVTDLVAMSDYTTISGYDTISSRDAEDVLLYSTYSQYYFTHPDGNSSDWYISRYYNAANQAASGWSDPVLGEPGDLFYDPVYPPEVEYGTEDQLIISRIRKLIGDPLDLRREYGEDAASSIHPDGKTYEMDEKGWPVSINMNGVQYTSTANPSVNGYRYLRFDEFIDVTYTVVSGCETLTYGVDLWYYTFRHSDRQIYEAYSTTPPPPGLTTVTATPEAYMLQCAIELLMQELWEDSGEDGAVINDEGTKYDPSPGLRAREDLLDKLKKRLDDLIAQLTLTGITGVRVD